MKNPAATVFLIEQSFDVSNGTEIPFGPSWGGDGFILRQYRSLCSLYPQIRQTLSVEFPSLANSG